MTEADHYADSETTSLLGIMAAAQVALLVVTFFLWAVLSPPIALSVTLVCMLAINITVAVTTYLSNLHHTSRLIGFQDHIGAMMHTAMLREARTDAGSQGGPIDNALSIRDEQFRNIRMQDGGQSFAGTQPGGLGAHLAGFGQQIALLGLAGALGIYFAPDIQSGLQQAVSWVEGLR